MLHFRIFISEIVKLCSQMPPVRVGSHTFHPLKSYSKHLHNVSLTLVIWLKMYTILRMSLKLSMILDILKILSNFIWASSLKWTWFNFNFNIYHVYSLTYNIKLENTSRMQIYSPKSWYSTVRKGTEIIIILLYHNSIFTNRLSFRILLIFTPRYITITLIWKAYL